MRLIGVVTLALVAACSVARPADNATGQEIYQLLCSNCHGAGLEGGLAPALGPGSNSVGRPDGFLEFSIVHGRGRMPSFRSSLSNLQVQRLIDFIRDQQDG